MGTRSRIGLLNEDGSITSIYCHWDGYVSNNGDILLKSYKDTDKIQELMELGNLSSLGHGIGVKHDHGDGASSNGCTAYGRDRGEDEQEAITHKDVTGFLDYGEEYNYLFGRDRKWTVQADRYSDKEPQSLTQEFIDRGEKLLTDE